MDKPREFWVNRYDEEIYVFNTKAHAKEFSRPYRRETIHVREVLPDEHDCPSIAINPIEECLTCRGEITDTMRLEWMIKSNDVLFKTENGYWWKSDFDEDIYFKTPREAIDAAIKESKREE